MSTQIALLSPSLCSVRSNRATCCLVCHHGAQKHEFHQLNFFSKTINKINAVFEKTKSSEMAMGFFPMSKIPAEQQWIAENTVAKPDNPILLLGPSGFK